MSSAQDDRAADGHDYVLFARCPSHGLHGERTECFVCGGPVEQVPALLAEHLDDLHAAVAEELNIYFAGAIPEADSHCREAARRVLGRLKGIARGTADA